MKPPIFAVLGSVLMLTGACAAGEWAAPRPTAVRTERDAYIETSRAGRTALLEWEGASRRAMRAAERIAPSFRQRIGFPGGESVAFAYRFAMVRGQSVTVTVIPVGGGDEVFVDAFHDMGDDIFRPVHWADQDGGVRTLTARTGGEYVIRIQPRMDVSGLYDVVIGGSAALVFPVAGADVSAIGSVFGDPRDNGTRAHEGVDIFAPRGTRVLAVADGYIEQARNTPTGGLVIWQTDTAGGLTYYYAHLDELLVREGTYVSAGDPIGRVGNTGNARGVRPHLHFCVYLPGRIATDPAPMLGGDGSE